MRTLLTIFTAAMLISWNTQAQDIYGFSNGNIVKVDPMNGSIISSTDIPDVNAIALGSSTFDHYNHRYIFKGSTDNGLQLCNIDAITGTLISNAEVPSFPTPFPNEFEYDLLFDVLYGLMFDYENYDPADPEPNFEGTEYLVALDPITAELTTVGEIEGVQAIFVNTSTFNSNNQEFFFVGRDSDQLTRLYTINTINAFTNNNPEADHLGNAELQYDVVNEKLYGLMNSGEVNVDSIELTDPLMLVEIDPVTAEYDIISYIEEANVLSLGSGVFDQATGSFIFVGGIGQANQFININVNSGEVMASPITTNVVEMQADNTNFANLFYNKLTDVESITTVKDGITIYPNPAKDQLFIEGIDNQEIVKILDIDGRLINSQALRSGKINIENLQAGVYLIQTANGAIQKFVKH